MDLSIGQIPIYSDSHAALVSVKYASRPARPQSGKARVVPLLGFDTLRGQIKQQSLEFLSRYGQAAMARVDKPPVNPKTRDGCDGQFLLTRRAPGSTVGQDTISQPARHQLDHHFGRVAIGDQCQWQVRMTQSVFQHQSQAVRSAW